MEKSIIKISVRELIEFVMRSGDLDSRFLGMGRAQEGTKAHKKLQKSNEDIYREEESIIYKKEVVLNCSVPYEEFSIEVEGRADGILIEKLEKSKVTIEEIKSTRRALSLIEEDYNELHWAQAKCYGYMFSKLDQIENLEEVTIQLTYYEMETEQIKTFSRNFDIKELEEFFYNLLDEYYIWAKDNFTWTLKRDLSIISTDFPFENYRKGQRQLAVSVYKTIEEGKKLLAEAPTGIGKTISTIFPSIKAMGQGFVSKIFYLTAKTITRTVAEEAVAKLKNKGLKARSITLTAKEKICFCKDKGCTPEECSYAKGHYDRVNGAIRAILDEEHTYTREVIETYAKNFNVCPFEFSLDISLFCDVIICDYNYAFDPSAALKRYFETDSKKLNQPGYVFLIDEAHNLVDRGREMYSAELLKGKILKAKKLIKGKSHAIYSDLDKINSYFINLRHELEEINRRFIVKKEPPEDLYALLGLFMRDAEEYLTRNRGTEGYEEVLELYFQFNSFLSIAEIYGENYVTYVDSEEGDIKLKLFCIDPSLNLKETLKKGRAAIFFSATLSPVDYFKSLLGAEEGDYNMRLTSPFEKENLYTLIAKDVSTKYNHRELSYDKLADYIKEFTEVKQGNYMAFFPSYQYMLKVYEYFKEKYPDLDNDLLIQEGDMSEEQREEFLSKFQENNPKTLIAFVVLGGIFSEGIDLVGDRLKGVIIVGVGLPKLCLERDIIREYYKSKGTGYQYSYMYPGMNKVLQASGRLIRTETDRGALMLIDDRFMNLEYERLFPRNWLPYTTVNSSKELKVLLEEFYN